MSFPETLTGQEVVEFYRRLRRVPAASADWVLKFASLNGAGSRAVGTYSGGMVQRLGLAVATLGLTEVLLLDEPTAALDPDGLCAFYGLVEERRRAGGTVFFSSHQLGDIERLADCIAVILGGRLVAELSERELSARLADRGVMRVRLADRVGGLLERVREHSPRRSGLAMSWSCRDQPQRGLRCWTSSGARAVKSAASPRRRAGWTRSIAS